MYGLKARNERAFDLMINLFKTYKVASYGEFFRYIKTNQDHYDDGYNIFEDDLMNSALNKFNILHKDNKRK